MSAARGFTCKWCGYREPGGRRELMLPAQRRPVGDCRRPPRSGSAILRVALNAALLKDSWRVNVARLVELPPAPRPHP